MSGGRSNVSPSSVEIRIRTYPEGFRQSEHSHEMPVMNVVLSGLIEETTPDSHFITDTWGIYIRPAGLVHANEYRNGPTRVLTIRLTGAPRDGQLRRATGDRLDVRTLRRIISLLQKGRAEQGIPTTVKEIERATRPDRGEIDPLTPELTRLVASEGVIREAAREVRMHPGSFSRRFRRELGIPPSVWRRLNRVRTAAGLLAGDIPLASVAIDAGFSDQSHMCRDFRNLLGITPREYRRLIDTSSDSA